MSTRNPSLGRESERFLSPDETTTGGRLSVDLLVRRVTADECCGITAVGKIKREEELSVTAAGSFYKFFDSIVKANKLLRKTFDSVRNHEPAKLSLQPLFCVLDFVREKNLGSSSSSLKICSERERVRYFKETALERTET